MKRHDWEAPDDASPEEVRQHALRGIAECNIEIALQKLRGSIFASTGVDPMPPRSKQTEGS